MKKYLLAFLLSIPFTFIAMDVTRMAIEKHENTFCKQRKLTNTEKDMRCYEAYDKEYPVLTQISFWLVSPYLRESDLWL